MESFTAVDQADNPDWFVKCLDQQYATGLLWQQKQRTLERLDLQPGQMVLDAGCGTGVDALLMAERVGKAGQVVGIDVSERMLAAAHTQATSLPLTFCRADLCALPFADAVFDRGRADKTFQHLPDPRTALQEMIRVLKPGGRVVIADPDHDSLIIDTPYRDLNRRFVQWRSDTMRQGGIAHQLYALCREYGLEQINLEPITTAFTDYNLKKVSSPYLDEIRYAQSLGVFAAAETEPWIAYLETAIQQDRFLCLQTYLITTAVKPL
jgi:ubiquinone/menaquinone biosynthesis C-methylase UbiE